MADADHPRQSGPVHPRRAGPLIRHASYKMPEIPDGWTAKDWGAYLRLVARYTAWLTQHGADPRGHEELMRLADRLDPDGSLTGQATKTNVTRY